MNTIRMTAAAAIFGILGGCAGMPGYSQGSDLALCDQARAQRMMGDPAWVATLDRIGNLHAAWYCQNYPMAWDRGDPGGG